MSMHEVGSVEDTKKWRDSVGAVICGFDAVRGFGAYAGPEVYHKTPNATIQGLHFPLIVGFDDSKQCWIIRNSWGTGWGMSGYGLIGYGECNIDSYAKLVSSSHEPRPVVKEAIARWQLFRERQRRRAPQFRNGAWRRAKGAPSVAGWQ